MKDKDSIDKLEETVSELESSDKSPISKVKDLISGLKNIFPTQNNLEFNSLCNLMYGYIPYSPTEKEIEYLTKELNNLADKLHKQALKVKRNKRKKK